ncbi:MAG TPA: universal stress protein, partial [Mycobacteriales bacterium]|nr:universal stress protein [Mycobacteriales bacterium]
GRWLVERVARRARRVERQLTVRTRLEHGSVASELLRLAAAADELVLGARGAGGFALLGLGSAATQLAMDARCTVTVVRGGPGGAGAVLVGVDGSACGQAALDYGFWFAAQHRLPVHAVHAFAVAASTAPYPGGVDARAARIVARQFTAETVEPWTRKYPHVPVRLTVAVGHSAGTLVAASAESALLVVGSRGHGEFAGMMLGSVSQAVVGYAHCPVTVAR